MENERRLNARDRESERTQFERRITELSQRYSIEKAAAGIIQIQWRSEYQPFEYCKHLNSEPFEVRISNSSVLKWSLYVLCPMY